MNLVPTRLSYIRFSGDMNASLQVIKISHPTHYVILNNDFNKICIRDDYSTDIVRTCNRANVAQEKLMSIFKGKVFGRLFLNENGHTYEETVGAFNDGRYSTNSFQMS